MSETDGSNGDDDRVSLDDPELRDRLIAHAREWLEVNNANQSFLAKQVARIEAVLARDVHESVQRAAGFVSKQLTHNVDRQKWLARDLTRGIAAIEKVSSLKEAVKEGHELVETMEYQRTDDLSSSEVLASEIRASVDAIEFATTADHSDKLRRASGAMERILGGVTELRDLGFSVGEIQASVDDFITQKTKHDLKSDFSLLGPVISDNEHKGTTRNKRSAAKKREQLLEQDQWVLRFLNEFWWKYWRNAFERSVPHEDEANVECARDVIPGILDTAKEPQDLQDVLFYTHQPIKDRRKEGKARISRIRFDDRHVLAALERLVQSAGSSPTGVVQLEGETPKYWTRHHAEAGGLKIVSPRLQLVPPDEART